MNMQFFASNNDAMISFGVQKSKTFQSTICIFLRHLIENETNNRTIREHLKNNYSVVRKVRERQVNLSANAAQENGHEVITNPYYIMNLSSQNIYEKDTGMSVHCVHLSVECCIALEYKSDRKQNHFCYANILLLPKTTQLFLVSLLWTASTTAHTHTHTHECKWHK